MLSTVAAVVFASSFQLGASAGLDGELTPTQYVYRYGTGFGARVDAQLRLTPALAVGVLGGVSVLGPAPTTGGTPLAAQGLEGLWMVPVAVMASLRFPVGARLELGLSPRLGWLFTRGAHGPLASLAMTGMVRVTDGFRVGLEVESQVALVSWPGWPVIVGGFETFPPDKVWGRTWKVGVLGGGRVRIEFAF